MGVHEAGFPGAGDRAVSGGPQGKSPWAVLKGLVCPGGAAEVWNRSGEVSGMVPRSGAVPCSAVRRGAARDKAETVFASDGMEAVLALYGAWSAAGGLLGFGIVGLGLSGTGRIW